MGEQQSRQGGEKRIISAKIGPVYGVDGAGVTASLAGPDQDQRLVAFLPLRGLWPKSHLRRNGQAILKLSKPCLNSGILGSNSRKFSEEILKIEPAELDGLVG